MLQNEAIRPAPCDMKAPLATHKLVKAHFYFCTKYIGKVHKLLLLALVTDVDLTMCSFMTSYVTQESLKHGRVHSSFDGKAFEKF